MLKRSGVREATVTVFRPLAPPLPAKDGALMLGRWHQVVFMDFDNRPGTRELVVQVVGEA